MTIIMFVSTVFSAPFQKRSEFADRILLSGMGEEKGRVRAPGDPVQGVPRVQKSKIDTF